MDFRKPVQLYECHNAGGNQIFYYTKTNQIKSDEFCLEGPEVLGPVRLITCHDDGDNQKWTWNNMVWNVLFEWEILII